MSQTLNLKTRYYRALPADAAGHEEQILELSLDEVAIVGLHCWNIGLPDGPPIDPNFVAGCGWPEAQTESGRIMVEVIRPAMDIARDVRMAVCHIEPDEFDQYYPQVPSRRSPEHDEHRKSLRRRTDRWAVQRSGEMEMIDARSGGENAADSPTSRMKRAEVVSPIGDEPLVFYTTQLDDYLQDRGVTTIIYTGFATDMCIINSEGGGAPMVKAGYRCILMRDATIGVETPDTFPERLATRYGIHRFEISVGYSTTFEDFKTAVESAA